MLLPNNTLPLDGLEFIFRLSLWIQEKKHNPPKLLKWKIGVRKLKQFNIKKLRNKEVLPQKPDYTLGILYVPSHCSGIFLLRQIRIAFCHGDLFYDSTLELYCVNSSKYTKISGSFTLDGLKEFISIFNGYERIIEF